MVVRHLKSFMEKQVNDGTYFVDILYEIEKAKERSNEPIIVVDWTMLFQMIRTDNVTMLCGMQLALAEQRVDKLFRQLTEAGAKLIFFCCGLWEKTNYQVWTAKQNEYYMAMIDIFEEVDNGLPLKEIALKHQYSGCLLKNSCLKLNSIVKKHGTIVSSITKYVPQELAAYAVQHDAFAIISENTDFLIFHGDWRLWSPAIDLKDLTTIEYNRDALLRGIRLQRNNMPLWATLCGNNFFRYEEVKPFHKTLGKDQSEFYKVADFVQKLPREKNVSIKTIQNILAIIYKGRSIPENAVEWFKESLNFYRIDVKPAAPVNEESASSLMEGMVLKRKFHYVTESILNGEPQGITVYFIDTRSKQEIGCHFEIITTLAARIAGVVLFHRRAAPKDVIVVTKRSYLEPFDYHSIPVIYPAGIGPPQLSELLSEDGWMMTELLERKLQLLRWVCCSEHVTDQAVLAVPKELTVTVLALVILIEFRALHVFEADLLLWIAHELTTGMFDPSCEPQPVCIDPRAFRVVFLYQSIYWNVLRAVKVLDLPVEYRLTPPYDGHRFHNCYAAWRDGRPKGKVEQISHCRLYERGQG
ncbi:uncharacterized protein LOC131209710 [Anopheles bellator]|uniref:uncharacterized protein LOC131209710 n=1 Tax=Anopheles bellator TaxID=139047 RepID=UPI0026484CA6|nr:uncharacterized protein LOC131209710 [Anopheles bellator]